MGDRLVWVIVLSLVLLFGYIARCFYFTPVILAINPDYSVYCYDYALWVSHHY